MKSPNSPITAMAFYHQDGFVPAWKQATKFAGTAGRIATLPDVVDARIVTGINDRPWNTYYTTTSAEYFGYSRGGVRLLIVAHGVGPMTTLTGIQKAYGFEYKDKSRDRRGGRITDAQFRDLEDGKYGDVHIIEFDPIVKRYEYPFMGYLTFNEAVAEPLLRARLGPRFEEYLKHHARMATEMYQQEYGMLHPNPYIIEMGDAANCSYTCGGNRPGSPPRMYPFLDKGDGPVAHLLSTSGLANVSHQQETLFPYSLANSISCHEWWNGVRLVAIREDATITDIHPGVTDVRGLILKHWKSLMEKVDTPIPADGFYMVMWTEDDLVFTQYPKKGARMDTYEPEFFIPRIETIGEITEFVTTIGGYHGFFKYDIKEVQAMRPRGANAYAVVGDPTIIWDGGNPTHHRVDIQFYRIKVDTSQRLIRNEVLRNDYDKLMHLLAEEGEAV